MMKCTYGCIKRAVITFNVFFWFTGPGILSLGAWFMVNIQLYYPVVEQENYLASAYIVMAGGIAITLFGIVGCIGALNENKCYISVFFSFVLIAFGCEVFATIKSFMVYDSVSPSIAMRLENSMKLLYHYNTEHTDTINSIQEELHCCGYKDYSDWQYYRYYRDTSMALSRGREAVPASCCIDQKDPYCNMGTKVPHNISKVYAQGCRDVLSNWIKRNIMIFGWTCLAMASCQIIGLVLSCCFCKAMKDPQVV